MCIWVGSRTSISSFAAISDWSWSYTSEKSCGQGMELSCFRQHGSAPSGLLRMFLTLAGCLQTLRSPCCEVEACSEWYMMKSFNTVLQTRLLCFFITLESIVNMIALANDELTGPVSHYVAGLPQLFIFAARSPITVHILGGRGIWEIWR